MWWLTLIDGPLPIGDIIYGVGYVVCGIIDVVDTIGVDNTARLISDGSEAVNQIINQSSSAASNPPPGDPRFRKLTQGNFRYNLQQLTGQSGAGMQAHHVFPVRFVKQFASLGINIHDPTYGAWVDASHQSWSAAYNNAWADFFATYSNPTYSQVTATARILARQFGFELNF